MVPLAPNSTINPETRFEKRDPFPSNITTRTNKLFGEVLWPAPWGNKFSENAIHKTPVNDIRYSLSYAGLTVARN